MIYLYFAFGFGGRVKRSIEFMLSLDLFGNLAGFIV